MIFPRRPAALLGALLLAGCMHPHVDPLPAARPGATELKTRSVAGLQCWKVPREDSQSFEVFCGPSQLPVGSYQPAGAGQSTTSLDCSTITLSDGAHYSAGGLSFVNGACLVMAEALNPEGMSNQESKPAGDGKGIAGPSDWKELGHLHAAREDYDAAFQSFLNAARQEFGDSAWNNEAQMPTSCGGAGADPESCGELCRSSEVLAALTLARSNLDLTENQYVCEPHYNDLTAGSASGTILGYAAMIKANRGDDNADGLAGLAIARLEQERQDLFLAGTALPRPVHARYDRARDLLDLDLIDATPGAGARKNSTEVLRDEALQSQILLLKALRRDLARLKGACEPADGGLPQGERGILSEGHAHDRRADGFCAKAEVGQGKARARRTLDEAADLMAWIAMTGRPLNSTRAVALSLGLAPDDLDHDDLDTLIAALARPGEMLTREAQELLLSHLYDTQCQSGSCYATGTNDRLASILFHVMDAGRSPLIAQAARRSDVDEECRVERDVLTMLRRHREGGLIQQNSPENQEILSGLDKALVSHELKCGLGLGTSATDNNSNQGSTEALTRIRQTLLSSPKETVLTFFTGKTRSFGLAISKESVRFWELGDGDRSLGEEELNKEIDRLLCFVSMDVAVLFEDDIKGGISRAPVGRCNYLFDPPATDEILSPDIDRRKKTRLRVIANSSQKLHDWLFPAGSYHSERDHGKNRWIIAPAGEHLRVPLSLLVDEIVPGDEYSDYSKWKWLGTDTAMVYAPGLSTAYISSLGYGAKVAYNNTHQEKRRLSYNGMIVDRPVRTDDTNSGPDYELSQNTRVVLCENSEECHKNTSGKEIYYIIYNKIYSDFHMETYSDSIRRFLNHMADNALTLSEVHAFEDDTTYNPVAYRRIINDIFKENAQFVLPVKEEVQNLLSRGGERTIIEIATHSQDRIVDTYSESGPGPTWFGVYSADKFGSDPGKQISVTDLELLQKSFRTEKNDTNKRDNGLSESIVLLSSCTTTRGQSRRGRFSEIFSGPVSSLLASQASTVIGASWQIIPLLGVSTTARFLFELHELDNEDDQKLVTDLATAVMKAMRWKVGRPAPTCSECPLSLRNYESGDPRDWAFMMVMGTGWIPSR